MARKSKGRGDAAATEAPVEVAEQEAPAAAADSSSPGKTGLRRGGHATADEGASAAVHALGPADSGKGTTDGEGMKPRLNKQKRNKTDQTPCPPASNADATGKSGDGCTDVVGVLGDAEVSMNPRNGDDPDRPEVSIGEKGTLETKKPNRKKGKKKKNMQKQQLSPSAVCDVEVDKSRTDCKDVEDVPGDDETIRSPRNEEDPGFSAVKIAEQEIPERKMPRRKTRKINKQEQSPSAVTYGNAIVVGTSGNDCTHGKCVPGVVDVSMSSRNGENQGCPEVNIAEKESPQRKKPKLKKPKESKHRRSPAVVFDEGAVQLHKSVNLCIDGDAASGDAQVSRSTRNVEHPYFPEVNIAEKEINERKKPKKRKNKTEGSSSVVLDAGADVADESRNGRTDGDGVPQDIEASICPINGEDPNCLAAKNADKGIPEMCKPKRKKRKKTNQEQSPSPALDAGDVVMDKSGHDSTNVGAQSGGADVTISPTHGKGVPGVVDVCMSSRNGEDQNCPEVNIAEKETPHRKKPKLKKLKENKQERSPAAVSDEFAVQLHKSVNVCIDGDAASGDAQVSRSTRNVEHPYYPEVNIAEKEINERKKPKKRKTKTEGSSSVILDACADVADESRNGCTDGDGVPQDIDASICPRNGEDPDCPAAKNADKGIPEMCKPKHKKRKKTNQEQSPSPALDAGDVVMDNSGHDSTNVGAQSGDADVTISPTHGKGVPGVVDVCMSSRNGEDQDCPEVNIAEKETPQRKKPKLKKLKENKQERLPAAVSDECADQLHKSVNACIDGDAASGDAQVSMSTRNVEHPYCHEVNIAEKETNERKKPKPKKRKNRKEASSSGVLDPGAVVADESRNGCTDGVGVPQDIEPSICPRNGEDPVCPSVKNADKGISEMCTPKLKKRKKTNQEQSHTPVLDADDVVMDKSGHDSTNEGAQSGDADVTISPRIGEGPEYSKLNATDDLLEGNKVIKADSQKSKLKKQMKNKHGQSPSAVPDNCAVVEDKSGKSYIDGKGSLGDTEISTSPRTGKDHNCPEVNMASDLVEGKHGNSDNSQKPKNWKRERKSAPVAVIETPPVGDVSSDERKDMCRTESMKVTAKSDIISMTSTSGENHKENVRDIYSPEGSLVRFRRKKLLILDLNGILADINTDRNVTHMADGRVRGKNVFKRDYLDDFLRFCFQNFELGIWSSRMKVNVDAVVDILMKDLRRHLVFCWDASQCTTTKFYTLEKNGKPLVLKELKKLWNKEDPDLPWEQGEFSPSNTLLVDDSPYKALRNPPHTAIFPQTYSYHMKDDESLGPGGDLRVYLENIAAADDVQRYVQEHPFGQPPITESDPHWDFYAEIHYKLDRVEAYVQRQQEL